MRILIPRTFVAQIVELGKKMGVHWTKRAAKDILMATDVNRDGHVSVEELWRWMRLVEVCFVKQLPHVPHLAPRCP